MIELLGGFSGSRLTTWQSCVSRVSATLSVKHYSNTPLAKRCGMQLQLPAAALASFLKMRSSDPLHAQVAEERTVIPIPPRTVVSTDFTVALLGTTNFHSFLRCRQYIPCSCSVTAEGQRREWFNFVKNA